MGDEDWGFSLFDDDGGGGHSAPAPNVVGGGRRGATCASDVAKPPPPRPAHGFAGLRNQGATCYLNSVLQACSLTVEFREELLAADLTGIEAEAPRRFLETLQRFFAELAWLDVEAVETKALTDSFGWQAGEVSEQQDISELNRILLDLVSRACAALPSLAGLVDKVYGFSIASVTHCNTCGSESKRLEQSFDIALPLKGDSLGYCLRHYFAPEHLVGGNQYFCETCGKKVDAEQRTALDSLPRVLTVSLGRFTYNTTTWQRVKLKDKIRFPAVLDLRPYVAKDAVSGRTDYELFGVIVHSGSANGGHYYAYLRSCGDDDAAQADLGGNGELDNAAMDKLGLDEEGARRHRWLHFNDAAVRVAKLSELTDCFAGHACAYMLLYRQAQSAAPGISKVADQLSEQCVAGTSSSSAQMFEELAASNDKLRSERLAYQLLSEQCEVNLVSLLGGGCSHLPVLSSYVVPALPFEASMDKCSQPPCFIALGTGIGQGLSTIEDVCGLQLRLPLSSTVSELRAEIASILPGLQIERLRIWVVAEAMTPVDIGKHGRVQMFTIIREATGASGPDAESLDALGVYHGCRIIVAEDTNVPASGLAHGRPCVVGVRVMLDEQHEEHESLLLESSGVPRLVLQELCKALFAKQGVGVPPDEDLYLLADAHGVVDPDGVNHLSAEVACESNADDTSVCIADGSQLVLLRQAQVERLRQADGDVAIQWWPRQAAEAAQFSVPVVVPQSRFAALLGSGADLVGLINFVKESVGECDSSTDTCSAELWYDASPTESNESACRPSVSWSSLKTAQQVLDARKEAATFHCGYPGHGGCPVTVKWSIAATATLDARDGGSALALLDESPAALLQRLQVSACLRDGCALYFSDDESTPLNLLAGDTLRDCGLCHKASLVVVRSPEKDRREGSIDENGAQPTNRRLAVELNLYLPFDSGDGVAPADCKVDSLDRSCRFLGFASVGRVSVDAHSCQAPPAFVQALGEKLSKAGCGENGILDVALTDPALHEQLRSWAALPLDQRLVWVLSRRGPRLLRLQGKGCMKQGVVADAHLAIAVCPSPQPPPAHSVVLRMRVVRGTWETGELKLREGFGSPIEDVWDCGAEPSAAHLRQKAESMVRAAGIDIGEDDQLCNILRVDWEDAKLLPLPTGFEKESARPLWSPPFSLCDLNLLRVLILHCGPGNEPPSRHVVGQFPLLHTAAFLTHEEQQRAAQAASSGASQARPSRGRGQQPERGVVIKVGF